MLQIYLEKIGDLLNPNKQNLQIRQSQRSGIYVEGLTDVSVKSEEELSQIMDFGNSNRRVSETAMNEGSSRSHSLFKLSINCKNTETESQRNGKLFLVDLAGSEKASKTRVEGVRLDEAKKINLSLTCLGNVIHALTEPNQKHIPYRDSKLTRILEESLGGNAKTTLIITCSPSGWNEAETKSTLLFGERAKMIKNVAKVNREYTVPELKKIIEALEKNLNLRDIRIKVLEK